MKQDAELKMVFGFASAKKEFAVRNNRMWNKTCNSSIQFLFKLQQSLLNKCSGIWKGKEGKGRERKGKLFWIHTKGLFVHCRVLWVVYGDKATPVTLAYSPELKKHKNIICLCFPVRDCLELKINIKKTCSKH